MLFLVIIKISLKSIVGRTQLLRQNTILRSLSYCSSLSYYLKLHFSSVSKKKCWESTGVSLEICTYIKVEVKLKVRLIFKFLILAKQRNKICSNK